MKILVTGQKGFIGSRLFEILKSKGEEVFEFKGDITNIKTFNKGDFDLVIHLASLISHHRDWSQEDYNRVNLEGTINVLNFYPKSKIIYISTKDVEQPDLNYYSVSKLAAEKIVSANPNNLVLRLPSVFGPNQRQKDKLIPRLINHFRFGSPVTITNNNEREYIFIDDVCEGIINNLDHNGLIRLNGFKVKNLRLRDLVDHTISSKHLKMSEEEKVFCTKLSTCLQKNGY